MTHLTYLAVSARQSETHKVLCFAATAEDVLRFSSIDRIGRDDEGRLSGFQRPQIASHIREIKDYLEKPDAVLPNPIVVAFTRGVEITSTDTGLCRVSIDISDGPPGLVVDGQQRLTALSQAEARGFQVFVSVLVCQSEAELRRQFVLINNTRPLPKSLIYELLPTVDGLPHRFEGRSFAADLTARLNHDKHSSLKGQINQHTNPEGKISDAAVQRVILASLSDGIMRDLVRKPNGERECFELISEFYAAVQKTFPSEWWGHTPRSSRLIHGAGISALGYVMEELALYEGSKSWSQFAKGLGCLRDRTAWTEGEWNFGGGDVRHWKALQNVNRDIVTLAQYLISIVRADIRARRSAAAETPLLDALTD